MSWGDYSADSYERIDYFKQAREFDLKLFYENYTGNRMHPRGSGGQCPFCDGGHSFSVYWKRRIYKCHKCQWSGDAMNLVYRLEGLKGKEAYELIKSLS